MGRRVWELGQGGGGVAVHETGFMLSSALYLWGWGHGEEESWVRQLGEAMAVARLRCCGKETRGGAPMLSTCGLMQLLVQG